MYEIAFTRNAEKYYNRLDDNTAARINRAIDLISQTPTYNQNRNIKKLSGRDREYSYRVGQYRIIYQIDEDLQIRNILSIGPQGDVYQLKWPHCRCQNNGKISKIIESHRHSFSRNRPQPALHNRDSGEVVGDYRNGYNELIHRKELVPSGTVSDKHLHT